MSDGKRWAAEQDGRRALDALLFDAVNRIYADLAAKTDPATGPKPVNLAAWANTSVPAIVREWV